jgi:hypothetical protein
MAATKSASEMNVDVVGGGGGANAVADEIMTDFDEERTATTAPTTSNPSAVWGRLQSVTPRLRLRADLAGGAVLLGRSHECGVHFSQSDAWISGKHCRLTHDPADSAGRSIARIEDLSTHGTWVNGRRVPRGNSAGLIVSTGDQIGFRKPLARSSAGGGATRAGDTYTLVLTMLSDAEREKQARCAIDRANPLRAKYDVLGTLGDGQYSVVYAAVRRDSSEKVAIKVMAKEPTGANAAPATAASVVNVKRELEILSRARHPCVVAVLDYHEDLLHRYIVLEFAAGGDLFDLIRSRGALPDDEAAGIFVQLLCAVKYLHSLGVIHR